MKRAVLCVPNPQDYIDQLNNYSIMIVNPAAPDARKQYLLQHADYSLKITKDSWQERSGGDYGNERLFWYTSGTTGDSKFCSFTQYQLDSMASRICQDYNITADDRYVGIMPLWHAHGQGFYWATKLANCETKFISIQDVRTMPSIKPTFITAVPDVLRLIGQMTFDNLRFIRSASSALSDKLYLDLNNKFGCPVIEAFGMTESLSHCFTNPLHGPQRMGTVGLPSGIEADIRDGELFVRGVSLFVNDWYSTGDLAQQDQQGYYQILGRKRDQINVKGYKIDPISIEKQLSKNIPDLGDCVIFGKNRVHCFYTGPVDKNTVFRGLLEIHTACKPSVLQQVEKIPTMDSGKISRSWLAERHQ
jgi:long-subunit acyl-CoA synthetase (AMP-forming)